MKQIFKLNIIDGHLVIVHDGLNILLDTGSPITLSDRDSLSFMDKEHPCVSSVGIYEFNEIKNLVDFDVDVLMGRDILHEFSILIDCPTRQITFSSHPLTLQHATQVQLRNMPGVGLTFAASISGNPATLVIDTGAKISYINRQFTAGLESMGERDDFYFGIGRFSTPIFETRIQLPAAEINAECGHLPQELSSLLTLVGIDGVLGHDLFKNRKVLINFSASQMLISDLA